MGSPCQVLLGSLDECVTPVTLWEFLLKQMTLKEVQMRWHPPAALCSSKSLLLAIVPMLPLIPDFPRTACTIMTFPFSLWLCDQLFVGINLEPVLGRVTGCFFWWPSALKAAGIFHGIALCLSSSYSFFPNFLFLNNWYSLLCVYHLCGAVCGEEAS